MEQRLFISYRRVDEAGTAGRLYDHLVHFAGVKPENVFMDVDSIVPGTNFVEKLNFEVAKCELMLVVLGRRWMESEDAAGRRRLLDPNDFVRIEIEAA